MRHHVIKTALIVMSEAGMAVCLLFVSLMPVMAWLWHNDTHSEMLRASTVVVGKVTAIGEHTSYVGRRKIPLMAWYVDLDSEGEGIRVWTTEATEQWIKRLTEGDQIQVLATDSSRLAALSIDGREVLSHERVIQLEGEEAGFIWNTLIPWLAFGSALWSALLVTLFARTWIKGERIKSLYEDSLNSKAGACVK